MALAGKRRRVLIIVENLPVPFDRRTWSEATALARAGYDVAVISPKGKGETAAYEQIDGVHIYRHPVPGGARRHLGYVVEYAVALFWQFVLSWRVRLRHGFDVIHACNPPDLIFLIAAVHKLTGRSKFVFDHHDLNPELYEAKFGRRDVFWRILRLCERCTFALADISIATNESYRAIACTRGRMVPQRVFVVRSGPDLTRVRTRPADPSWKNGRPFLVAYVGVIGPQEGLDLLLQAAQHIRDTRGRQDVQFVVVGDGPALPGVRARATAMALDDMITFTGRLDDDALFTVLSTADLCVNPDRPNCMNDKSTMNKIMEYMALGKPIVQFDLTEGRYSAQEASLYARCGDTADFGEKILCLLDDPGARARMGKSGAERVRTALSWEHEAPKLLLAYEKLLGAERASPDDMARGDRKA